jgi:hypothetical protein
VARESLPERQRKCTESTLPLHAGGIFATNRTVSPTRSETVAGDTAAPRASTAQFESARDAVGVRATHAAAAITATTTTREALTPPPPWTSWISDDH